MSVARIAEDVVALVLSGEATHAEVVDAIRKGLLRASEQLPPVPVLVNRITDGMETLSPRFTSFAGLAEDSDRAELGRALLDFDAHMRGRHAGLAELLRASRSPLVRIARRALAHAELLRRDDVNEAAWRAALRAHHTRGKGCPYGRTLQVEDLAAIVDKTRYSAPGEHRLSLRELGELKAALKREDEACVAAMATLGRRNVGAGRSFTFQSRAGTIEECASPDRFWEEAWPAQAPDAGDRRLWEETFERADPAATRDLVAFREDTGSAPPRERARILAQLSVLRDAAPAVFRRLLDDEGGVVQTPELGLLAAGGDLAVENVPALLSFCVVPVCSGEWEGENVVY